MSENIRFTLAIDTTVHQCALSLRNSRGDTTTCEWEANRQLDSVVFSKLNELLTKGGATLADIDTIAVNRGPGSFIGSRIGLAVANTFATTHNIPVCGVCGLATMAAAAYSTDLLGADESRLYTAVNCVRRDIFFQTFHLENGAVMSAEPEACGMLFESFVKHVGTAPVLIRGSKSKLTLTEDELSSMPGSLKFDLNGFIARMHHEASAHTSAAPLPHPLYVKPDSVP